MEIILAAEIVIFLILVYFVKGHVDRVDEKLDSLIRDWNIWEDIDDEQNIALSKQIEKISSYLGKIRGVISKKHDRKAHHKN